MRASRRFLAHDHQRLDALLTDFARARRAAPDGAPAQWRRFCLALRGHLEMEERALFPAYEADRPSGETGELAVLRAQHRVLLALIHAVERAQDAGSAPDGREDELLERLRVHEAREEALFRPWLGGLDETALRALIDAMGAARRSAQSGGALAPDRHEARPEL